MEEQNVPATPEEVSAGAAADEVAETGETQEEGVE